MFTSSVHKVRGFTLIELMMVIAIIGLLASMVLAALQDARASARDAQRIQASKQIQTALELYRNANAGLYPCAVPSGSAPNNTADLVINMTSGCYSITPYLPTIPVDPTAPTGANNYSYWPDANRTSYTLGINRETDAVATKCKINSGTGTTTAGIQAYPNCY